MTLTLAILRCPPGVPPERRRIDGGAVTIGRGAENDWVLADPERVLSKRHCTLARGNGLWEVTDTSTNGTFVNQETERVGTDAPRALRDGDRLRLGTYEIEVLLQGEAATPEMAPWAVADEPADDASAWPADDRLTGDPFPLLEDDPLAVGLPAGDLSSDVDPLGALGPGAAVADHVPAVHGSFEAPRATFDLLPDDWDAPDEETAPLPEPAAEAPAQPPGPPAAAEDGVAALLAGAGVSGRPDLDPAHLLTAVGEAFRAVVGGLRRTMVARATIKGEFRVDRTMLRASGNNPLKFAADDGDALATLLRLGRRGDMAPKDAIADAFRDLRLHELATAAAMQQAVRDVLAELAPARVERELETRPTDRLPGRREARAWRAYRSLHARTLRSLHDGFDSVFGRSFARAYERAMGELVARGDDGAEPPSRPRRRP